MSRFTVTIPCPRGYADEGDDAVECGCPIRVECEADGVTRAASYWHPAEAPELSVLSILTTCPRTHIAFTDDERAEAYARAEAAMERHDDDPGPPCRCGDVCRC